MGQHDQEANDTLYEIVESGRLVFFTGAGFSADLRNGFHQPFPGWVPLLRAVLECRQREGRPPERVDLLDQFLVDSAEGPVLIEAASILRHGFEREFDEEVAAHLTPAADEDQDPDALELHREKQELLRQFRPRGIVTVNVDPLHEHYLEQAGELRDWNVANPLAADGETALRQALLQIEERPFLLKAHGTCGGTIAFDFATYRRLMAELPIYQAFMTNLFMNYRMVFVGFGLSDLDFDFLLQSQALAVGAPLRQHVALFKKERGELAAARERRAALLAHRYGVLCRWYEEHSEWPGILREAASTPGRRLHRILDRCLDPLPEERGAAHAELANLGPAGKHVAVLWLTREIRALQARGADGAEGRRMAELVYTLGTVDPPVPADREHCRQLLLDVLTHAELKAVAAHALLALDRFARPEDLPALERLQAPAFLGGLRELREGEDPDNRIPAYLQFLIFKLRARANS